MFFTYIQKKLHRFRKLFGEKGKAGFYQLLWDSEIELNRYRSIYIRQQETIAKLENRLSDPNESPQRKYELEKKLKEQQKELAKTAFMIDGGINPEKNDGKEYTGLQERIIIFQTYIEAIKEEL